MDIVLNIDTFLLNRSSEKNVLGITKFMMQSNYNFMKCQKFWLYKVTLTKKDLSSDSDTHPRAKCGI